MPTFSTEDVAPRDRFAHWREVRAKIFGVSIDLDREQHGAFQAECHATPVEGAALVEMHASSYRVERLRFRDLARGLS